MHHRYTGLKTTPERERPGRLMKLSDVTVARDFKHARRVSKRVWVEA